MLYGHGGKMLTDFIVEYVFFESALMNMLDLE